MISNETYQRVAETIGSAVGSVQTNDLNFFGKATKAAITAFIQCEEMRQLIQAMYYAIRFAKPEDMDRDFLKQSLAPFLPEEK